MFRWCVFPVDLISIDRRSLDREAECLEQARILAEQFLEKVRDTEDHMWKPARTDAAPAQSERWVRVNLLSKKSLTNEPPEILH